MMQGYQKFIISMLLRVTMLLVLIFFFSSRRRHTRFDCDWSSDVCSSDLADRSNHSHEQKPRVGQGREFAHLFRPTGGANQILRCHKHFVHTISITHLKSDRKSVV